MAFQGFEWNLQKLLLLVKAVVKQFELRGFLVLYQPSMIFQLICLINQQLLSK